MIICSINISYWNYCSNIISSIYSKSLKLSIGIKDFIIKKLYLILKDLYTIKYIISDYIFLFIYLYYYYYSKITLSNNK